MVLALLSCTQSNPTVNIMENQALDNEKEARRVVFLAIISIAIITAFPAAILIPLKMMLQSIGKSDVLMDVYSTAVPIAFALVLVDWIRVVKKSTKFVVTSVFLTIFLSTSVVLLFRYFLTVW